MSNKDPMRGKLKSAPADAPEYLALKTHIIDGHQVNRGATVHYAGIPGKFLRAIDGKGKAIVAKVKSIMAGEGLEKSICGEDRTRDIQTNLRAYSDELLNVVPKEDAENEELAYAAGVDVPASQDYRAEWLKHAKATKDAAVEDANEFAVRVQLMGDQPSTVVPTTGPLAEATNQEKAATQVKLGLKDDDKPDKPGPGPAPERGKAVR